MCAAAPPASLHRVSGKDHFEDNQLPLRRLTGYRWLLLGEEVVGLGAWLALAAFWTVVAVQPGLG